jgi:hypothetical protein
MPSASLGDGGVLRTHGSSYSLAIDPERLDSSRFCRLVDQFRVPHDPTDLLDYERLDLLGRPDEELRVS